ncbi:hypothetical protein ACKVMT_09865 [Halobacteriales archaeon Cl-PHB]
MICRVDDRVVRGRTGTVSPPVAPETVATAIRQGVARRGETTVRVTCKRPHAVHQRVGCVTPEMSLRPRTALAEAGRARGLATPVDDRLAECRATLAAVTADRPETDGTGTVVRRDVAEAETATARLRERVAAARGRLQARREAGLDEDPAATDLAAAVGELSEVETAAAAATERHETVRRSTRETRTHLEERFRLEDEVGNLEREARRHLVARLEPAYEAALAAVPGLEGWDGPFDAPTDAMALAVARVAGFDAPVVVAGDRFDDADAAARWLGAPVLRCSA